MPTGCEATKAGAGAVGEPDRRVSVSPTDTAAVRPGTGHQAAAVTGHRPQAELGRWLREQRRDRGWNVPEMTRRLRQAATATGDKLPRNECLYTMIRRWERGDTGVSERYMLHYCGVFGIGAEQFGPRRPPASQSANGDGTEPDTADAAAEHAGGLPGTGNGQPGPASGAPAAVGGPGLAKILREVRDGLRADAKVHQQRAEQMTASAISAAICRGQALAYAVAAEHIDAALASSADATLQP